MEGTYLSILPPELLHIICSYLNNMDIYTCTQNPYFLKNVFYLENDKRINLHFVKTLFKQHNALENITVLNMTGIHWIPAADIRTSVKKLENLNTLLLFDTKMDLTKCNMQLYVELKKLRVLGLTEKKTKYQQIDPGFKKVQLDYFFYHKKNDICKLWVDYNVDYLHVKKISRQGQKIYNNNWLQCAVDFVTGEDVMQTFDANYKRTACIQHIDEQFFAGPDEIIITKFASFNKVNHLLIKPNPKSSNIRLLRLHLLKFIPNIVKLDIDIPVHLGANFLLPICANCPNLKFLKIKNDCTQMNMIHLQMARALEDFSYTTEHTFNLSHFFMEFQKKTYPKLRRLYVNYGMRELKLSLPSLSKFLTDNTQLHCFILVNKMTHAEMKQIQEMFNEKSKTHYTYFKVMKELYNEFSDIVAEDIPTCHYDLFDCEYEVATYMS